MKYPKIQTIFNRDPLTNYKGLLMGQYALPEFEYLHNNEWEWSEKIDGTNIRVFYEPYQEQLEGTGSGVFFGGRTDNAQIPTFLLRELQDLFPVEKFEANDMPGMILFGEGYGAKIQKVGSKYISNYTDFILFDVFIGGYWLRREDIVDIANTLEIKAVPIVGRGTIPEAIYKLADKPRSMIAESDLVMEGFVLRPKIDLLNRHHNRIVTKIKVRDLDNTELYP